MIPCPNHPTWPVLAGHDVCVECAIRTGEHQPPDQIKHRIDRMAKKKKPKPVKPIRQAAGPPPPRINRRVAHIRSREELLAEIQQLIWEAAQDVAMDLDQNEKHMAERVVLHRMSCVLRYGISRSRERRKAAADAKAKRQAQGLRVGRLVTVAGVTQTIADWARQTGICAHTIRKRLDRGEPEEDVMRPVKGVV